MNAQAESQPEPRDPRELDMDRVRAACDRLGAHFDTVQIFCTKIDGDNAALTLNFHDGVGNFYARYGQAKEWVVREEERSRIQVREE